MNPPLIQSYHDSFPGRFLIGWLLHLAREKVLSWNERNHQKCRSDTYDTCHQTSRIVSREAWLSFVLIHHMACLQQHRLMWIDSIVPSVIWGTNGTEQEGLSKFVDSIYVNKNIRNQNSGMGKRGESLAALWSMPCSNTLISVCLCLQRNCHVIHPQTLKNSLQFPYSGKENIFIRKL